MEALNVKEKRSRLLEIHVVKRMQNVSGRPPLLPKAPKLFFSQAVFPAFGEETQLGVSGYLELRLDFLPLHFPPEQRE